MPTKKMRRLQVAEPAQRGLQQDQHGDQARDQNEGAEHGRQLAACDQTQERHDDHQARSDRQSRGAPGVRNLERRRGDEDLVRGELVGGLTISSRKASAATTATMSRKARHRLRQHADKRRHAHVLVPPERHHGAEHRQPQEEDRGELVRPDERLVEDVAADDAGEEHDDLGDDEQPPLGTPRAIRGGLRSRPPRAAATGAGPSRIGCETLADGP